jgi:hypothetical protein
MISDDANTKGLGGFFTDEDGSTRISMRDIDPVVYLNIDTMKVGNISKPFTIEPMMVKKQFAFFILKPSWRHT